MIDHIHFYLLTFFLFSSSTGKNPNNSQMVWGTGTYGVTDSDLQKFYDMNDVPQNLSLVISEGYKGKRERERKINYNIGMINQTKK